MGDTPFDVIQVGYGPVSQGLALMLGRQGRRVAVCERWEQRYPLPRAVCIDHELYRVLSANGLGAVLPSISHPGPPYQWFNADWKELLVIDWSAGSISGGTEVNFVHQPTLEAALDVAVLEQPTVEIFLGWEAIEVRQDDDLAHVTLRNVATNDVRTISARYVIGSDGANSLVRTTIGGGQEDRGFEADWLVIDVLLKEGVTAEKLGIPAAGQYCNPIRPTTIVPAGVRDGRTFRRWEFMRLPGESIADLEGEDRVWELLQDWAGPDDVELVRHKVYNFRSLLADRWHDRRLILAGDAAHVMPPFMGQGMCSGLRDAWNLSWRLGLLLDGTADNRLLDSYQPERRPHVSQLIDMSIYLGKVICIPDLEQAAARDHAFLSGAAEPPPPFPQLIDGLLHRDSSLRLNAGAGLLSPHVAIESDGSKLRLDDYTGPGFVFIGRGFDWRRGLDKQLVSQLATIDAKFVRLEVATDDQAGSIRDCDGRLDAFLDAQGWDAMIVRPDFYVYGGGSAANSGALVQSLIADLKEHGVHLKGARDNAGECENEVSAV
ncbi:3-(3-hydroxy-phenyl)propionate hydroxylase [Sphingobium sp. AP50]|uniref:bifunctional 3-(3-hydroxy-phenyl)propionate/3-hydroxycinnamic acid hydroxylase MhpA n=1 Tax=Sphingobium sp. AP50 TaxID=1884369 RepID=UPI0008BDE91F|nr:bifunctional 3-(3-hydroxy-phenyl)propionate/3-hydroxycinnamic acid hydroxylase [Sphingobium sp. AP50]SEK00280.1 3-(3-hydroxy-phenyl)propionate hydroxylase [Sphingobium sp. AP50]